MSHTLGNLFSGINTNHCITWLSNTLTIVRGYIVARETVMHTYPQSVYAHVVISIWIVQYWIKLEWPFQTSCDSSFSTCRLTPIIYNGSVRYETIWIDSHKIMVKLVLNQNVKLIHSITDLHYQHPKERVVMEVQSKQTTFIILWFPLIENAVMVCQ